MTSGQHARFYLSGAEAIAFTALIVAMNFGFLTPTFGAPGDLGGIASATTSKPLFVVVAFGVLHHIVQAHYNSYREDPKNLSVGELRWDVFTSWLPFIAGLVCFPLGWGADWWFWFKLAILGIVAVSSMDDILPTWASFKELWSR